MAAEQRIALLLGDPVGHSLSPLIHNTAFRATDFPGLYLATRVPPQSLESAVSGLRDPQILGANVTIPHKSAVVPFLDGLSSVAKDIGAVNTIVRHEDGELIGHNTDVEGFLAPLEDVSLEGVTATVFGNGGAARAVIYGLLRNANLQGIAVLGRSAKKSERLIEELQPLDPRGIVSAHPFNAAIEIVCESRLIVNATPVGMHPIINETPWSRPDVLHPDQIVYDLVYTPTKTRLLREAEAQGATIIGGLDMLVAQAAAAFSLWTRRSFPTTEVLQALSDTIL